jgi:gliding motility-associated-like protein
MKKILFFFTFIFLGLIVSAQTNISGVINDYAAVSSIDECTNSMSVDVTTGFSIGDSILIVQMKGATMDVTNTVSYGDLVSLNNAGLYEYNTINSIVGNVITFDNVFQNNYQVTGFVQIVSFPNYTGNVTVNGVLTASAWNGLKGGILTFKVGGVLTLNENIDVSSLGFRGGVNIPLPAASYNCNFFTTATDFVYPNGTEFGSGKGEGIVSFTLSDGSGRGKQLNGGGGGNDHNSGAGGGGGPSSGGIGGQNLEPSFGCQGDFPGVGGVGVSSTSRFIFSGAGGAGHGNTLTSANIGGNAGGMIFMEVNSIVANGDSIKADGQHGNNGVEVDNDGGAGGGAGGLIYFNSAILAGAGVVFSANGGEGSDVDDGTGVTTNRCHGTGGGGGGGLVTISLTSGFTSNVIGGSPGVILNSTNACNGTSSGAASGVDGVASPGVSTSLNLGLPFIPLVPVTANSPIDTLILCQGANISIDIQPSDTVNIQWQVNSSGSWIDLVNNIPYSGVQDTVLLITNAQTTLSGNFYRALLYTDCDSLYLDSSVLILNTTGIVTANPSNKAVCLGDTTSFFAEGSNMVSYIWQCDSAGIFLDIANNSTYSNVDSTRLLLTNVRTAMNGVMYRLRMIDECGDEHFSNNATLFLVNPSSILLEASDLDVCEFSNNYFFISTANTTDSIFWQLNSGAGFSNVFPLITNDTLFLNNISLAEDSDVYRAILVSPCLNDTSTELTLTVNPTTIISFNESICNGDSIFLANSFQTVAGVYYDTLTGTAAMPASNPVFYTEDFEAGAPTWTLNTHLGLLPALGLSNLWEISVIESGQPVGTCSNVASIIDASLFLTSAIVAGASYIDMATTITHKSAESGNISTLGLSGLNLNFEFIGNGEALLDNASLDYSIDGGISWLALSPSLKSLVCGVGAATWEARSFALPSTCENIANLRIRFVWENDGTGAASDPSFAVNNITITNLIPAVAFACDSLIETALTVLPTSATIVNDTICSNEMYTLPDGVIVNIAGIYLDTLSAVNTCDSLITTNLTINPTVATTVNDTICSNEMYTLPDGAIVNIAGVYLDTLSAVNTCDSVITTNLTINPTVATTVNDTICSNEMYTLPDGVIVNIAGTYIDTLPAVNTCDSVITTNLTINLTVATTVNDTICSNEMYTLPNGAMVNTTGVYLDTLSAVNTCDSLITTNLTVNLTTSSIVNDTICSNEMYTLPGGAIVNVAGVYLDTLAALNTCDNVITTNLTVIPTSTGILNVTICDNQMYTLPSGGMVSLAGVYLDTISALNTCDSVFTVNLTVNPTSTATLNDTICNNQNYTLPSGLIVSAAGSYLDTIPAVNTCDSVITINLTLLPTTSSLSQDTICDNDTFILPGGTVVNTAGVYLDTLAVVNTCDNVITTTLIVIPSIVIVTPPTAITVCQDSSALFYIEATGTDITYQWQINTGLGFNNIPGVVNDTLIIANASAPINLDGVEFRVILNSYCGNAIISDTGALSIDFNVVLNSDPNDAIVCEVTDTSFTATTNGNETNVQWQVNSGAGFVNVLNNTNYNGANALSLVVQNTPLSFDGNTYRAIVSDNCGFVDTTNFASLTVNPLPVITLNPTNVDECLGNDIQFVVTATNTLTYQWQVNSGSGFSDILGETNDTLNVLAITQGLNGNIYQCLATNNCGTVTSSAATLVVNEVGTILSEPSDVVICPEGPGFNFDLTVVTNNINNFQWQIDTGAGFVNIPATFLNINGETTNSIEVTVPYENVDGAKFRVVYVDDCNLGGVSNEYGVRISEPDPVIGIEDLEMCQREIEMIEVDYGGINYVWDDSAATSGRFLEPTEESGEYIVTFMQNSSSCLASDTINVTLRDCLAECVVTAPTGFSPTGSVGFNDVFSAIYGCDLDFFEMIIVNRWGEIMFSTNDPVDSWDGTYKGNPMPLATYAWYISFNKEGNNNKEAISGNVTLVR